MEKEIRFGKEHASHYDKQWEKLAPLTSGLHFVMQILFDDLPGDAHILCVGAGTGAELMFLAQAFPSWKFTAVDPALEMLSVLKSKVESAQFSERIYLHHGYLETLPEKNKFDAATSILVSQFMPQKEKREQFFKEIGKRLRPNAYLVSADLTSPETEALYDNLIGVWAKALRFAGLPEEKSKNATSAWRREVAVSKAQEIETIIAGSGFDYPVQFYQSLFIRAWYAKRIT